MDNQMNEAAELVSRMTVEEQALLLSGDGWWRTHGIERLGLPAISASDGTDRPVTLPPGRATLSTRPSPTASPPAMKTIGMVLVTLLAARVGPSPAATMTSTSSFTSSAARSRR